MKKLAGLCLVVLMMAGGCAGQKQKTTAPSSVISATNKVSSYSSGIIPAADQFDKYLPLLKGKNVALLVNQTSTAGGVHLVDALLKAGVNIKVIFGPEHGFRGDAPDGAKIETTTDAKTGIKVVSLYGKKTAPSAEDLAGVNMMVYDIQDVGARFYTFISSMQYFMEAALVANIPMVILDRPNPNGFYVDGPVLDTAFKSFVGMQPIPVVYGMTIGEYANMILNEGWLSPAANAAYERRKYVRYAAGAVYFSLEVVKVAGYTHQSKYVLPVAPSPNLPEIQSVYWYPSTCFFEGTVLSEGRGTPKPFQYIGHPSLPKNMAAFTPKATTAAPSPKNKDLVCYGYNLSGKPAEVLKKIDGRLQLKYLLEAYQRFPDKAAFFTKGPGINRLAGTDVLMKQIIAGTSETDIRKSWEPKLSEFKAIRKKYLLYD